MGILFRFYRVSISPIFTGIFGIHCRYEESCSRYAERNIREKGLIKGLWLGVRRFMSCW